MELMFFDMQRKSQRKRDCAMVFVDIHGDTAQTLLNFVHNRDRERLVYVSSAINKEANTNETYTAVINPFEVPEDSIEAKAVFANEIADALTELLESSANTFNALSIQMSALLRPAIFTVMCSPDPSLATLARFFLDKDGQNADLLEIGKNSPIPIYRQFFQHDWQNGSYTLTKSSIRTKLLYFLADPMLHNMVCGRSTVRIDECLQAGKVLILDLPQAAGRFTSSVVSRLTTAFIHACMTRRAMVERKERKSCWLFLDEYHEIACKSIISNLTASRKWGLSCVLAVQSTSSLEKNMKNASMVNCGIKIVGLLDHSGKLEMSKELQTSMTSLDKLQKLEFMARKNDGRHTAYKFRVPILAKRFFLSASERKSLMDYLVYESGIYRKAPLSLTNPVSSVLENPTVDDTPKKVTKDDLFDDNLKPHFS